MQMFRQTLHASGSGNASYSETIGSHLLIVPTFYITELFLVQNIWDGMELYSTDENWALYEKSWDTVLTWSILFLNSGTSPSIY